MDDKKKGNDIDFGFLGDMKVKTMGGTDKGSVYMVLAEADGLRLGIRPLMFPRQPNKDDQPLLMVGARLRVVATSPEASILTAESSFGMLGFKDKGEHASQMAGIAVTTLPPSINEVITAMNEHKVAEKFVDDLMGQLAKVKAEILVSREQLLEWCAHQYDDTLPDVEKMVYDYSVVYGA